MNEQVIADFIKSKTKIINVGGLFEGDLKDNEIINISYEQLQPDVFDSNYLFYLNEDVSDAKDICIMLNLNEPLFKQDYLDLLLNKIKSQNKNVHVKVIAFANKEESLYPLYSAFSSEDLLVVIN